ncbi:MAG: hypothetical protein OEV42_04115 [Deltaproteobacteria bacterium]|nr:hypothetical protein [Deltaproteobacteria bacterium]
MKKEKNASKMIRCKHCGGPMRLYRDGINCLMCGRTLEHSCERCKFTDDEREAVTKKQVA